MKPEKAKKIYNHLFDTAESKAKAFDAIAEKYYFSNFGSVSKSDFEVLLFSLYIEQILVKNEADFSAYSDYTLSTQLGITQSRVSSLKVKKELIYPHEGFEWQDSFLRILPNVIYEDGKIKLYIPDRNLYLEIKNAIENSGGFIEVQLTSNLLQVRLEYFLDLLIIADKTKSEEELRRQIIDTIGKENKEINLREKEPIGKALLKKAPDVIIEIAGNCIPFFGDAVKTAARAVLDVIRNRVNG